jgi:hypothetical protein
MKLGAKPSNDGAAWRWKERHSRACLKLQRVHALSIYAADMLICYNIGRQDDSKLSIDCGFVKTKSV